MALKIPREPVTSSTLASVGYDVDRQILAVEFHSGHIYHYAPVSPDVARDFVTAESLGGYFGRQIRGHLPGEKMTGACTKCGDAPGWIGDVCEDCGTATYQPEPPKTKKEQS